MAKKGMLLASETLKMVLALICLGFLVFLVYSLYFNDTNSKKFVQAEATMERIKDIVEASKEANFTKEEVNNVLPFSWKVFIFTQSENKPNQCSSDNCLCICRETVDISDRQINVCSDSGVCKIISNLKESPDIKIEKLSQGSTTLLISKSGNWLEVTSL